MADSSSEESENSCDDPIDKEYVGKDLDLLVKKFSRFKNGNRYKNDLNISSSSSSDHKKCTCFMCEEPQHYIGDCPLLKEELKKENKCKKEKYARKKKKHMKKRLEERE